MNRVAVFVDGFNLYHSIEKTEYRWLDLKALTSQFITSTQKIRDVYYFTAYANWDQRKVSRHQAYIKALKIHSDVNTILGELRPRNKTCYICKNTYKTHEEKQTDVNMAIKLLEEAMLNHYDTAIIVTADSDILASLKVIKEHYRTITIGILLPPGRTCPDLVNFEKQYNKVFIRSITHQHLSKAQLPNSIIERKINKKTGRTKLSTYTKPPNW